MSTLRLLSPAKLNLLLRINFKRPDGYHDLTTLFERINLCDTISLSSNQSGKIRIFSNHPQVPRGPKNLVYKAAQLLRNDFAIKEGVDITIAKNIPVAAGLGGGSSNAATMLLGLNKLWKLSVPFKKLVDYGRTIGSDVPFFLHNCSWAIGKGRGDVIQKLSLKRKFWHILVIPRLKVYTRDIFMAFSPAATNLLTKKTADVNILRRILGRNGLSKVGPLLANDLETTLVGRHPNLLILKEKLRKLGAWGVCFSGSGPSIFGLVDSQRDAQKIQAILLKQYSRVFVAQTL